MAQPDDEREVKKADESDMRNYQDRTNALKKRIIMVQFKLEIQDKELKNLKGQYLKAEEKLSKLRMTRLHQ